MRAAPGAAPPGRAVTGTAAPAAMGTAAPAGTGTAAPAAVGTAAPAAPLVAVDGWRAERSGDGLVVSAGKRVDPAEAYLAGHFPGLVIYPGVFFVETLKQAVAPALDRPLRVAALRSARFLAPLLAGDELAMRATVAEPDAAGEIAVRAEFRRRDGVVCARLVAELADPVSHDSGNTPGPDGKVPTTAGPPPGALLPHRGPMLLVDRATRAQDGTLTAYKEIRAAEACYRNVPPDRPRYCSAYPESLLVESFGQSAALLWFLSDGRDGRDGDGGDGDGAAPPGPASPLPLFSAARDVRLHGVAYPGDLLRHEVRLDQAVAGAAFAEGQTFVAERRIATFGSMIAVVRPRSALTPAAAGPPR